MQHTATAAPKFKTRGAYAAQVKAEIIRAGERPQIARYDDAGNCAYCGEAGRCPGWHPESEVRGPQTASLF